MKNLAVFLAICVNFDLYELDTYLFSLDLTNVVIRFLQDLRAGERGREEKGEGEGEEKRVAQHTIKWSMQEQNGKASGNRQVSKLKLTCS